MNPTIRILVGEGIECEKESERCFRDALGLRVERVRVQDILRDAAGVAVRFQPRDWLFLPGGFSFADHFGSGRLLGFELARGGFVERLFGRGAHMMGICNGFQTLAELNLFGADVRLRPNQGASADVGAFRRGFVNRWVQVRGAGLVDGFAGSLCVRHGEGRITRASRTWATGVEPILFYDDEAFDNGSLDRVAGLTARHGSSLAVGLMPHPEIAARESDHPNAAGAEHFLEARRRLNLFEGPGVQFLRMIMKGANGA